MTHNDFETLKRKHDKLVERYPGRGESSLWVLFALLTPKCWRDAPEVLREMGVTKESLIEHLKNTMWADQPGFRDLINPPKKGQKWKISYEVEGERPLLAGFQNLEIQEIE